MLYNLPSFYIFNLPVPPAPEVNITAVSVATVGTALTLECSVSVVPHLITTPRVELSGPGEVVLASDTGLSLTHTLDPVLASNAGQQYICKAVLEIESLGVPLMSQSTPYSLTVQSKSMKKSGACDLNSMFILYTYMNM